MQLKKFPKERPENKYWEREEAGVKENIMKEKKGKMR